LGRRAVLWASFLPNRAQVIFFRKTTRGLGFLTLPLGLLRRSAAVEGAAG